MTGSTDVPDVRHHTVQVPATSANLGPGFDAFGLALNRYLVVRSLSRSSQVDRVVIEGDGTDGLPTGDDNLVWRSVVAFCAAYDLAVPDVALRTTTTIPVERGLGSSSAAIVAGVVLARALTGAAVGDRDLVGLLDDIEGHPDNVAPALLGGLVACTVDAAGHLVVRRRNPAPNLRPMVLVPSDRQSTEAARAILPGSLPRAEVAAQAARAGHVLAGLVGAWPVDPGAAGDLLHEPVRFEAMPATGAVVTELREAGVHAWLSGAGPSVAVTASSVDATGLQAVNAVAERHGFTPHRLDVDLAGALACPDDGCAIAGRPGCVQCPRERL